MLPMHAITSWQVASPTHSESIEHVIGRQNGPPWQVSPTLPCGQSAGGRSTTSARAPRPGASHNRAARAHHVRECLPVRMSPRRHGIIRRSPATTIRSPRSCSPAPSPARPPARPRARQAATPTAIAATPCSPRPAVAPPTLRPRATPRSASAGPPAAPCAPMASSSSATRCRPPPRPPAWSTCSPTWTTSCTASPSRTSPASCRSSQRSPPRRGRSSPRSRPGTTSPPTRSLPIASPRRSSPPRPRPATPWSASSSTPMRSVP